MSAPGCWLDPPLRVVVFGGRIISLCSEDRGSRDRISREGWEIGESNQCRDRGGGAVNPDRARSARFNA
jgi:hypothetical protein